MENRLQTISQLIAHKAKDLFKQDLYQVVLYGDYADGTAGPDSVMEYVVIADREKSELRPSKKELVALSNKIIAKYHVELNLDLLDLDTYNTWAAQEPYKTIREKGKVVAT